MRQVSAVTITLLSNKRIIYISRLLGYSNNIFNIYNLLILPALLAIKDS
jgi:hypothetical protein